MFSKAALVTRNAPKMRPVTRKMGSYVTDYKPPTMADLPVPSGAWEEAYAKKQRSNNLQLLAGIVFTAGTLGYAKSTGLVDFGWGPKVGK